MACVERLNAPQPPLGGTSSKSSASNPPLTVTVKDRVSGTAQNTITYGCHCLVVISPSDFRAPTGEFGLWLGSDGKIVRRWRTLRTVPSADFSIFPRTANSFEPATPKGLAWTIPEP